MKLEFINGLFGYSSRIKILICINKNKDIYGSKIIRCTGMAQKSVWDGIRFLKKEGLIYYINKSLINKHEHRIKYISLTKKGKLIIEKLKELEKLVVTS